jgi:hypothetical protein
LIVIQEPREITHCQKSPDKIEKEQKNRKHFFVRLQDEELIEQSLGREQDLDMPRLERNQNSRSNVEKKRNSCFLITHEESM